MTAAGLTAAQAEVLREQADAVLPEQAGERARLKQAQTVSTRAAERRRKQRDRLRELGDQRSAAVQTAEVHARAMAGAMREALRLGGDMAELCGDMSERVPTGLAGESGARRLSDQLSALLRTVTGHASRFGNLTLARTWARPETPWGEEMTPIRRDAGANGKGTDHE